jgi:hypothetical protein
MNSFFKGGHLMVLFVIMIGFKEERFIRQAVETCLRNERTPRKVKN